MLVLVRGLNKAALKSMERRQDGDLEEGIWNETMSELDHEWIFEDTSGILDGKQLKPQRCLQVRLAKQPDGQRLCSGIH